MKQSRLLATVTLAVFLLAGLATSIAAGTYTHSWGYDGNRIAISADGNSAPDDGHRWKKGDPDDWGATPATLAIIAKLKMQNMLVHYSYNNFIEAPAGPDSENQMKIGVDGALERWGFDENRFFDVTKQLAEAKEHLKKELARSTAEDPLYFIHMGPAEFFYQVVKDTVDQGDASALKHVYIVSHSGYNDNHLRRDSHHTLQQAIDYSGGRLNCKRIGDQNGKHDPNALWNSERDFSPWYWLRDHQQPSMRWLYRRMQANAKGVADISDAGMLYWLLLGDENGSPAKFNAFIGDGIPESRHLVEDLKSGKGSKAQSKAQSKALIEAINSGQLILIEAEDFSLRGKWRKVESVDASGGAYIEYGGPNKYRAVDEEQTIELSVKVVEPGSYTVKWFMRQPSEVEGDKANDAWINFPDAVQKAKGQVTGFHKFYGRSKGGFGLNGVLESIQLHYHSWLNVTFAQPGVYRLQLSGRSNLLQIDRFVLYREMDFKEVQSLFGIGE